MGNSRAVSLQSSNIFFDDDNFTSIKVRHPFQTRKNKILLLTIPGCPNCDEMKTRLDRLTKGYFELKLDYTRNIDDNLLRSELSISEFPCLAIVTPTKNLRFITPYYLPSSAEDKYGTRRLTDNLILRLVDEP